MVSSQVYDNIVYVRQLPYQVNASQLLSLFDKYGKVVQIRLGTTETTKGSAFVVYDKSCPDALEMNGYHFQGRYLVVRLHRPQHK